MEDNELGYSGVKCKEVIKADKSISDKSIINIPRRWSQLSYAGLKRVPSAEEPNLSTWSTYFLKRDEKGRFIDEEGNIIAFSLREPNSSINFEGEQLKIVEETLKNLTPEQIAIAKYWGDGPPTKQFTPVIDKLIDTYNVSAGRASRILAAVQAAINDAAVVTWYFKYLWDIARPNQLNQNLATVLCTPKHPTYPAGHAVIAGCAEKVLSYFFQGEKKRLKELAEECAESRIFAGVHFPIDCTEGMRLGRQIGTIIVNALDKQRDGNGIKIDYPITENKHAILPPPPYKQVIPYQRSGKCDSKIIFRKSKNLSKA
ncbi:vanadium-dependent haloperoxidase [Clostridium aciditolerans]|uniref:Vanadium-dependent haloperoxidase n=1 Tax=Clostridium aciditolerans TaxID=339861 RepID=A0A934I550_9CLOT|nr:vanadium-dependent haloperoxidase [Clostridium aciditolerans]MBI6875156.1 vanadium-dependent haloperoxidase [Clostridium aciditolerans]